MSFIKAPAVALLALLCMGAANAQIRVCISEGDATTSNCKSALEDAYGLTFECSKHPEIECLERVRRGEDHVTIVGGDELFAAHNLYNLAAIVAESGGTDSGADIGTASYFGMALTQKKNCETIDGETNSDSVDNPITGLDESLKGFKGCHTGYRKTSGWFLPVGYLSSNNFIDFSNWIESAEGYDPPVRVDAETMEHFWGASDAISGNEHICAPHDKSTDSNGPRIDGSGYGSVEDGDGLCKACKTGCGPDSPYADYPGALFCVDENPNDRRVALVKQSTPLTYSTDKKANMEDLQTPITDFVGICPTVDGNAGGCKEIYEPDGQGGFQYKKDSNGNPVYESCSTGKSASNAMVSRRDFVGTTEFNNLMSAMGLGSEGSSAPIDNGDITDTQKNALTNEEAAGLWGSDTVTLYRLENPTTDAGFKSFFTAYESFRSIRNSDYLMSPSKTEVKVCVPENNNDLVTRCTDVMNVEYGTSELYFQCYNGNDAEGCMTGIKNNDYDITTFGGNELFTSYEQHGLEPLVAEIYITGEAASYFGIGVVKASKCSDGTFTGKNKASLEGKDSCHTGYRKTAGWYLPVGNLLSQDIMPTVQDPNGNGVNTDAYSTVEFFGRVCAPRTTDEGPRMVNGEAATWDPMCELCKEADGVSDPCAGDQDANPYYDYTGAFRCMMEGDARVGWVKHTTFDDYAADNAGFSGSKSDYRILCTDGCREWTEANYKDPACSNGESASQSVVARAGYEDDTTGAKVKTALLNGGNVKLAAKEIAGEENFFWSQSTESLEDVSKRPFEDTADNGFFQAYSEFKTVFNLPEPDNNDGGSGSPSGDGDATESVDVTMDVTSSTDIDLSDESAVNTFKTNFASAVESTARADCTAKGTSCPNADFTISDVSDRSSRRRSLLATELRVTGTLSNITPDTKSTFESGTNLEGTSIGGVTVDNIETSGASIAQLSLGAFVTMVLSVILALA